MSDQVTRNCSVCGGPISPGRLEAIPEATTCTACSPEKKKLVFPVYSHKTAPETVVVDPGNDEAVRQADRANRRGR